MGIVYDRWPVSFNLSHGGVNAVWFANLLLKQRFFLLSGTKENIAAYIFTSRELELTKRNADGLSTIFKVVRERPKADP